MASGFALREAALVTEDECLVRFGLTPRPEDVAEVRRLLDAETAKGVDGEDSSVVRLLCVQLFHIADLGDVLRIWRAKRANFDNGCSVDVQLLCGAGLAETRAFLRREGSAGALEALEYLDECVGTEDFVEFSVAAARAEHARYYGHFAEEDERTLEP